MREAETATEAIATSEGATRRRIDNQKTKKNENAAKRGGVGEKFSPTELSLAWSSPAVLRCGCLHLSILALDGLC